MNDPSLDEWEAQVRERARRFRYPLTPPLRRTTRRVTSRRWITPRRLWTGAAIALAVLLGASIPPVRAAVLRVIEIGAVRIWLRDDESVQPTIPASSDPMGTPRPTRTPLRSVLELSGATSLEQARRRVDFPILLPTHPPDLGPPDRAYLQDIGGPLVVLAWLDPHDEDRVRLSLHIFGEGPYAEKSDLMKRDVRLLEETSVNGQPAVWVTGEHLLLVRTTYGEDLTLHRLVQGNVLIWESGSLTYRLETDQPLDEAIRIAESIR
jgi:hypothetical protein